MNDNSTQDDEMQPETTARNYFSEKIKLLPILVASFVIVDIAALFISVNYTFTEMFYLCGIVMILLAIGSSIIILLEGNPLWAYICAIVFGLMPIIEIIIHIATVPQDTTSLALAIVTIFLAVVLVCFLIIIVPIYQRKKAEKTEG